MSRLTVRQYLRLIWHTRPGHSGGLIKTRRGVYCAGCGKDLSK